MRAAVVAVAALAQACTSFHELAEPPIVRDAAVPDVTARVDAQAEARAHAEDANGDARDAASPPDFACRAPWTSAPGVADPRCLGRRFVAVVETSTVTVGGVSIARTASGRVGVAYDDTEGAAAMPSEGLHLATFLAPDGAVSNARAAIVRTGYLPGSIVGRARSLAAGGTGDVLRLAYVDEDVLELHYQELVDGGASLGPVQVVTDGIGAGAYVSASTSAAGETFVGYFLPSLGAIRCAERAAGGGFAPSAEVTTGLVPGAGGVGQLALFVGTDGTPNLLYESGVTSDYSTAVYAAFDGAAWSPGKTMENDALEGYSGLSPSVAAFGATKYASYFFVPPGETPPYPAELHLATWRSYAQIAQVEILLTGIPASDATGGVLGPRFQAALAVDGSGLLHLVVVRPGVGAAPASLEYRRQMRVDGGVAWLTDVIDPDVLGHGGRAPQAFVALSVEASGRPHIAYRSGRDGAVYYATRLDR